ncbi:MAG: hypothetical protein OXG49_11985 [Chloroflexi bacterium]|nr:hypothetical protein [Chloroflexota bacterium]
MDIARLIDSSFNEAVKALTMGTSPSSLARARERAFIKTLIAHWQREFAAEDIRVFAASKRGNAADFGTNHLLYDIAVCRAAAGESAERKSEDFLYIAEALWQIEVDFSREWRSALHAINRLNCGAAAEKLLIATSKAVSRQRLLDTLRAPASACPGSLYLALVPHPADWEDAENAPQVWRMAEDAWGETT